MRIMGAQKGNIFDEERDGWPISSHINIGSAVLLEWELVTNIILLVVAVVLCGSRPWYIPPAAKRFRCHLHDN